MFVFSKKKKITLDCFTNDSISFNLFPIQKGTKHIPEWFKNLPREYSVEINQSLKDTATTMKSCPGFIDLFKNSFILPLWADLKIRLTEKSQNFHMAYEFAGPKPKSTIQVHDHRQYKGCFNNDYLQAKIVSPWLLKEKKGVKFSLQQSIWNMKNPTEFLIPPGLLDFKYQNNFNINLFFYLQKQDFFMPAGMPLCHLMPLTDNNIILKNHLVDDIEYEKMWRNTQPFTFINSYHKKKKYEK